MAISSGFGSPFNYSGTYTTQLGVPHPAPLIPGNTRGRDRAVDDAMMRLQNGMGTLRQIMELLYREAEIDMHAHFLKEREAIDNVIKKFEAVSPPADTI